MNEYPLLREAKPSVIERERRFLNFVFNKSKPWIAKLNESLADLLDAAHSLSDSLYFKKQEEHLALCQRIDGVLSIFSEMPKLLHEKEVIDLATGKEKMEREEIGIFAISRIQGHVDRLKGLSSDIRQFRRNCLLVIDRAGSGKTNLICDFALALATKQPLILIFGKENLSGTQGIIRIVEDLIARALDIPNVEPANAIDVLLEKEGIFLHVFIDGINESRGISEIDVAIAGFLQWSTNHRIKVTITCRDIYWTFFNYDNWKHYVKKTAQGELNEFSATEYSSALPLYLSHYNIRCELAEDAKRACQHPLLLRFFCEAYGSIDGPEIQLGLIRDIRLKELFDEYFHRKMEQIRQFLHHGNVDLVVTYLSKLIAFMFNKLSTSVLSSEIESATGDSDLSTEKSLYLRLLDEDIIIEEHPTEAIDMRRISFVYEEFMEYLLARTFLTMSERFGFQSVAEIFQKLNTSVNEWVNARGVGEYIGLMLLEEDFGYLRQDAIVFLGMMARGESVWPTAFWSVVGKCSEKNLRADMFDLFSEAITAFSNMKVIRNALDSMSRYSQEGCQTLAAVLLWTIAVPKVLSWRELDKLPRMSQSQLQELSVCLKSSMSKKYKTVENISYKDLMNSIRPYVGENVLSAIDRAASIYGEPITGGLIGRNLLQVIWRIFPKYHPLLINGLFSIDREVRSICADRIRFTNSCVRQVTFLCESIVEDVKDPEIRGILQHSVKHLEGRLKKDKHNSFESMI